MGRPSNGNGDDISDILESSGAPTQNPAPAPTAPEAGGVSAQQQTGGAAPSHAETLESTLAGYPLGRLLASQLRLPGSAFNVSAAIKGYESSAKTDPSRLLREMRGLLRDVRHNRQYFVEADAARVPILQQSLVYNLAIRELRYLSDIFRSEFEHIDRKLDLSNEVTSTNLNERLSNVMSLIQTAKDRLRARARARASRLEADSQDNPGYKRFVDLHMKALAFLEHNYPRAQTPLYDGGANYPLQVRRGRSGFVLNDSLLPAHVYIPVLDNRFSLGVVGSPDKSQVAVYYRYNQFITTTMGHREKAAALAESMLDRGQYVRYK